MNDKLWRQLRTGFSRVRRRARQTGEKLEDLVFTIGEGETTVASVQEINRQSDPKVFVCMRTDTEPALPSHRLKCDYCGTEVWMSPGTKLTYDKLDDPKIMCTECLVLHHNQFSS